MAYFVRLKELADKEQDVDKKMALRKVFRSLQGVRPQINELNRQQFFAAATEISECLDFMMKRLSGMMSLLLSQSIRTPPKYIIQFHVIYFFR